jgi:hypothetical protein
MMGLKDDAVLDTYLPPSDETKVKTSSLLGHGFGICNTAVHDTDD